MTRMRYLTVASILALRKKHFLEGKYLALGRIITVIYPFIYRMGLILLSLEHRGLMITYDRY